MAEGPSGAFIVLSHEVLKAIIKKWVGILNQNGQSGSILEYDQELKSDGLLAAYHEKTEASVAR